mgnify:CR=1 FL=1
MSFLTAEWRKLIMVNYEINPKIVEKYVPFGTELDLFEGKCYVSLVGFMFLNTRLYHLLFEFTVIFGILRYAKKDRNYNPREFRFFN